MYKFFKNTCHRTYTCTKNKIFTEFSITNGISFFNNIAFIGEMSSGKSTLLNALLGDFLAETGHGRTTKTVQCFYEDKNVMENQDILEISKKQNVEEEKFPFCFGH